MRAFSIRLRAPMGPECFYAGEAYEFEVKATADTPYLSFATMFVQSNDLFVGPGESQA